MSTLKNSVQLIGHLGADPEIKTLDNGNKVARIRLATTESHKNKNGEWTDETTWHSIVAWDALAERIQNQLNKGSYILLEGKLTSSNYVNSKGEKRYIYEVRASNFIKLDKKETVNAINNTKPVAVEDDGLPF